MLFLAFAVALLACLGHLVLLIGTHNWFYGQNFSKRTGDVFHLAHAVLVLALPVVLLLLYGWDLAGFSFWPDCPGERVLVVYLYFCVLVAVVWLPLVTYWRSRRLDPSQLTRSEVVDVAQLLGHRPVGNGHHAFLARFPGNQLFQIEYVERTLFLPCLPAAWDGLTVLHISDLHFHGTPDRPYFEAILARCAEWAPDLVALTGDIADSPTHHEWIVPLLGRLKPKIAGLAILGNHDHRHEVALIRQELRRLGYLVLENDWLRLDVRGEPLVVIGDERPWLGPAPDLSGCPEGAFRLCLSHTPDNIAWARRQHIELMLSGHVHGGQICLPPFGCILIPSRYGRRYDAGTFDVSPTLLHVSRGVSGEHPVRYNCRPELTLLTLRRGRGFTTEGTENTEEQKKRV